MPESLNISANISLQSKNVAQELERVGKIAKQALTFDPQNKELQQLVDRANAIYSSVNKTNDALKKQQELENAITLQKQAQQELDDSKAQKRNIERSITQAKNLGKEDVVASKQVDLEKVNKAIASSEALANEFTGIVATLKGELAGLSATGADIDKSLTFESAKVSATDLLSLVQQIDEISTNIITKNEEQARTEPTITDYRDATDDTYTSIDAIHDKISDLRTEISQIIADAQQLMSSGLSGAELANAFTDLYARAETAQNGVTELKEDITTLFEVSNTDGLSDEQIEQFDSTLREADNDANSLGETLDKLIINEFPPVEIDTTGATANVNETNESLDTLSEKEQDINNNVVNVNVSNDAVEGATYSVKELIDEYNTLKQAMKDFMAGKITLNDEEFRTLQQRLVDAKRDVDALSRGMEQAATHINQSASSINQSNATISSSASKTGSEVNKVSNHARRGTSTFKVFTRVISNGFKTAYSYARSFTSAISGRLTSALNKVKRVIDKTFSARSFKRGLTTLLKYTIGVRSLYFAFRKLRNMVKEGIENLVQYQSETNLTNQRITEMNTSLLYLKNAWASAFAPIINVALPALNSLIDALANTANAFARFIGNLTGQEVVLNAVKVDAQDYAESLKTAGSNAGGAADKVKKLTDRLAGFDDLNVLGKDNDDDTSGGGGGGLDAYVPDPSEMFEYVDSVSTFADMLKDAWASNDFSSIGVMLRDKIIGALNNIKWEDIQTTAKKMAKSFGSLLVGIFGDPKLFIEVGNSLAEGLNTIVYTFQAFIESIQGVDFGGNLSKGINEFFAKVDLTTAFNNIVTAVTTFRDNLISFLKNLNWEGVIDSSGNAHGGILQAFEEFGSMIGQVIHETLGNEELMTWIANGVGNLINGVVRMFQSTLDGTSGEEIGSAIYKFFETLLDTIEWEKLSGLISDGLVLALNAITKISDELAEDDSLQVALEEFFGGLKLDTIFEALGKNISSSTVAANTIGSTLATVLGSRNVADSLTGGISALIGNLRVADMVGSMVQFLGNLLGSALADPLLPLKVLGAVIEGMSKAIGDWIIANNTDEEGNVNWGESMGWFIIEGVVKGIGNAIESLFALAVSPFIAIEDAFTSLFQIESPSKVFEEYGEFLIEGLTNGINNLLDSVKQIFIDLHDWLSSKWEEMKTNASEKWSNIKSTVTTKAGELKTKAEEKITELKDKLSEIWSEIKSNAYEKFVLMRVSIIECFNVLKDKLKEPVNGIIGIIEGLVNKVIDGINSLTSGLSELTGLGSDIASAIGLPSIPSIGQLPHVTLPRLAQGAVIPPNKEFMAVLGDQSSGTNIEAPLDTIKQAVAEELAGQIEVLTQGFESVVNAINNKDLSIGDKEIGKANARYTQQQKLIRGVNW